MKIQWCQCGLRNQLDVTQYYIYFSFISCSTCFGPPCAHLQELTTYWYFFTCGVVPWLCRQSDPAGWLCVHWGVCNFPMDLSCIDVNIGAVLGCKSVTTLRYYIMFLVFIVIIFVDLVTMSIFCSLCICVRYLNIISFKLNLKLYAYCVHHQI